MKLVVFSHKIVWKSKNSPTGYATDGGFAFHMKAISEIFDETTVVVPLSPETKPKGEVPFSGHNLKIHPIDNIQGQNMARKMRYPFWLLKNFFVFIKLIKNADAVHTPIPSDIGTLGMLLAKWMGKPLLVRHCGNWLVQKTKAEHFWKSFMEKNAGGKNVMLVTGLEDTPASANPNIKWIFSSSLRKEEIDELQKHRPTFDPENPRLIIACRQDKPKGTGVVIEALAKLKSKHSTIHLDVLGEGYDLDYFKSLAKELGVDNNVTFHGKVNHDTVLELMQKAHIFCYPTAASEGFPKVVHEALASGLPVVGTPVSAIKRLLKNGAGILIEKPDPNELSLAIETILSDSGLYYDMQEKAIKTAESFSLDAWRDEIKGHILSAWGVKV